MAKLKKGKQKGSEQTKATNAASASSQPVQAIPPLPIPAGVPRTTLPQGGYFKEEFSQAGSVHPDESTQRYNSNTWGSPAGTVTGGDAEDAWGTGASASGDLWGSGQNIASFANAHAGQASPAAGWGASKAETSATGTGSPFVNIQPVNPGHNAKLPNARKGSSLQNLLSSMPQLQIPPPPPAPPTHTAPTAPPIPSFMNMQRHQAVPASDYRWDTPIEGEDEDEDEDEEGWDEEQDEWGSPAQNRPWGTPAQAQARGAPAQASAWGAPAQTIGWNVPAQGTQWGSPAAQAQAPAAPGGARRTSDWNDWATEVRNLPRAPGLAPAANATAHWAPSASHEAAGRPVLEHQQANLRSILTQPPLRRDPRVQTDQAARDQAYADLQRQLMQREQESMQQQHRAPANPGYAARAARAPGPQPVRDAWGGHDDDGWDTGRNGWADPIAEVTEEEDEEENGEYEDEEDENPFGYVNQYADPALQRKDSNRSHVRFDSGAAQASALGAADQYDAWGNPAPPQPIPIPTPALPPLAPPPPSAPSSRSRRSMQQTYWGDLTESKTMAYANGRTTTAVFELMPPRNGIGENQFVDSRGIALEDAQRALYGVANSRLAKQRIYWGLTPDKDQRVSGLLRWIHEMANGLATIGLQRFIQTGERGALISNAAYRENTATGPQPAFDWLPIQELQRTLDHRMQETVALYDPGVQAIVYVFLLSKTGNSLAVWRRKLMIPEDAREIHAEDIETTKELLQPSYPVYVDELPVKSEADPGAATSAKRPGFFSRLFRRKAS